MKTSQRAARFRDLLAAATTPLPQTRDQYHAMARHYLILAETHGRKARPSLQRERLKGQKFKFGKKPSIAASRRARVRGRRIINTFRVFSGRPRSRQCGYGLGRRRIF